MDRIRRREPIPEDGEFWDGMNPRDRIHPELHGLTGNRYSRNWLRKRRVENIAAGKTWDGRPRKREIRFDLVGLTRNERHVITNRELREKKSLRGGFR